MIKASKYIVALLCLAIFSGSLNECSNPKETIKTSCPIKYAVHLGVTNHSGIDTLAHAMVSIDDSIVFDQTLRVRNISSTDFQKSLKLCKGAHLIKTHFGRYQRDTTMMISDVTYLFVDMNYETAYPDNNTVMISALKEGSGSPID